MDSKALLSPRERLPSTLYHTNDIYKQYLEKADKIVNERIILFVNKFDVNIPIELRQKSFLTNVYFHLPHTVLEALVAEAKGNVYESPPIPDWATTLVIQQNNNINENNNTENNNIVCNDGSCCDMYYQRKRNLSFLWLFNSPVDATLFATFSKLIVVCFIFIMIALECDYNLCFDKLLSFF